jgi:iron complex outermembrane receptor protein
MHSYWLRRLMPGRRVGIGGLAVFLFLAVGYGRAEEGKAESFAGDPGAEAIPPVCSSMQTGQVRKLAGVVSDQKGSGIARARITLACGEIHLDGTADESGAYSIAAPAGKYLLTVVAAGFGEVNERITVPDTVAGAEVDPVLKLAELKSSVTVSAENAYATTVSSGGTKMDLPLNEVPQAISVVNREELDAEGAVKLDDALKNVAGVMAGGYYDGWDYYRIRGFDASFNTYIDGLRGGNGVMEETWGLESVEVLKGPSSALYGQSVLGGLVNIVTRKPVPATFMHAQVTAGSYNFVDPAVDFGGSLNPSHSLYGRVAALYHSGDTFVDYTYRHRYYIAPSLTWRPTEGTSLTLIGRAQRDNGRQPMPLPTWGLVLPNPNGRIPISRYIGELEANANKNSQATEQIGYQFFQKIGEHFILHQNTRLAWYHQDWNRIYYPDYLDLTDYRTLYRYPLSWHGPWQAHTADTNLEGHGTILGTEHDALLGFEFFRNPTEGIGWIGGDEPLDLYNPVYGANPIQTLTEYTNTYTVTQYSGIYLQDHIRLPKHVTITGGGRLDLAKNESRGSANQNGKGWTPRLGVTWQVIPSTTLYASFSKSYYPQSGQVYVNATTSSYLPPERGQQWEGGVKSSFWRGRITPTVAVFQLNRDNVATSDEGHPNFYLVTGSQRSRGVELEATVHPLTGLNVTTAYSYINAEVLNGGTEGTSGYIAPGTPTLNAPKNIFNVWSTYEIPSGWAHGLSIGLGGRHFTDQAGDLQNSFQLPGYGVVDGSLTYRHGPAEWRFNAYNLTNARYAAGSYNNVYVNPGEPRTVRGTFAWFF